MHLATSPLQTQEIRHQIRFLKRLIQIIARTRHIDIAPERIA